MSRTEFSPEHISVLNDNEIFVFGSNIEGQHMGGAARTACRYFGAEWGVGEGLRGHSYAIPTMGGSVESIRPYVDKFIDFCAGHPELRFLLTSVGCGIAGYRPAAIAPLFARALDMQNVLLPRSFAEVLLASGVQKPDWDADAAAAILAETFTGFEARQRAAALRREI